MTSNFSNTSNLDFHYVAVVAINYHVIINGDVGTQVFTVLLTYYIPTCLILCYTGQQSHVYVIGDELEG